MPVVEIVLPRINVRAMAAVTCCALVVPLTPPAQAQAQAVEGKANLCTDLLPRETVPLRDGPGTRTVLDGTNFTVADAMRELHGVPLTYELAPSAVRTMLQFRDGAEKVIEENPNPPRVYGWNQALGPLKDDPVNPAASREFQSRILHSHAVNSAPALPLRVARLALVIRANQMARGHMAVRPDLSLKLLEMVNKGVVPLMPQVGTLGSGDLQQMAVAGLAAIGGPACVAYSRNGEVIAGPASEILPQAGIAPIVLEMGEALPIISGSTAVAASFLDGLDRARTRAARAEDAFALFMEATRAEASSLDARTHSERGIPEQKRVAARLRGLVDGSEFMTDEGREKFNPADTNRIQDAVTVRAAPHIMASLWQTIGNGEAIMSRELNASTSNPLLFRTRADPDAFEFVMGGNWDGSLIGHAIDTLNANITDLGVLTEALSARLLSAHWSYGLPANLIGNQTPDSINSGMVQLQTVATALISEMQTRAFPSGVLSRSAKDGQEDHNSMAMSSARNLHENLDRLGTILAILHIMDAQAVDLVWEKSHNDDLGPAAYLGVGTGPIYSEVRSQVTRLRDDRDLTPDLATMIAMMEIPRTAQSVGDRKAA